MITFYYRFLKSVFQAKAHGPIQIGEETEVSWFCLPHESEGLQTMNASRIINAAESSTYYHNLRNGFIRSAMKHRIWPVMKRYHVEFHKPVRVFRKFTVRSRFCFWTAKAVFWHHRIFQGETLCCEIYGETRLRSHSGAVSPFEAQKLMGVYVPSPPAPEKLEEVFAV